MRVVVGIVLREEDIGAWSGRLPALAERSVAAGIDHLTVGDHVSFADGHGADGLIQAAALLSADPHVSVQTGVYLIALRHPAVVARQLATIALLAPGRFTFGVGVGGDDPSELELCGIDPRHRGARTTEALRCVRQLMSGEPVDFRGRFFELNGAIRPAPTIPIPVLVGGRSDAALARTGQLGDGWLALQASPRRFTEAIGRIEAVADEAGRGRVRWQHALQTLGGLRCHAGAGARASECGHGSVIFAAVRAVRALRTVRSARGGGRGARSVSHSGLPALQLRPRGGQPRGRNRSGG